MIPRVEEGSQQQTDRKLWCSRPSDAELTELRQAIMKDEGCDVEPSLDDLHDMDEVMNHCYISVFHNYKNNQADETKTTDMYIITPEFFPDMTQIWVREETGLVLKHSFNQG